MLAMHRTAALIASAALLAACTSAGELINPEPKAALAQAPQEQVVLLDGMSAAALSVQASQAVWAASPVAVIADAQDKAGAQAAAAKAVELAVPAFALPVPVTEGLTCTEAPESASPCATQESAAGSADATVGATPADPGSIEALRAELARLGVQVVWSASAIPADALAGIKVVTGAEALPEYEPAKPIGGTASLTAPKATTAAAVVAKGSLAAAGVTTLELANRDPRQRKDDVTAMAHSEAEHFIAVGAGFGPLDRLTTRIGSALTGVQLPGGGQTVFYDKRYVAMYGHPLTGALGVLGEQSPAASVKRVEKISKPYQEFADEQIIPAFEIIATVAAGDKGKDGNFSNEWDAKVLLPYIKAAEKNGIYVLLDLQSGMSTFLEQAKLYEDLLKRPQVGLALDPEWKLKPGQKPLAQFGSVDAKEINATSKWLAELTAENNLPQKMFLLHQFRVDMITNRDKIDMSHDELAYVSQMDGTGSMGAKLSTWQAVLKDSSEGMRWGWKNFYDEDQPTPSPRLTYTGVTPKPWWVSYQ